MLYATSGGTVFTKLWPLTRGFLLHHSAETYLVPFHSDRSTRFFMRSITCSSTLPSSTVAAEIMLRADKSQESAKAPTLTSSGSVPASYSLMSGFIDKDTLAACDRGDKRQR